MQFKASVLDHPHSFTGEEGHEKKQNDSMMEDSPGI
jgi:hypothetical protein